MKFIFFSIKYRYSDILLKEHKLHLSRLFCCIHACYCVIMMSVTSTSHYITSVSRYHPRYLNRSSMYIRVLIPRNFAEFAEAVPIEFKYVRPCPEVIKLFSYSTQLSTKFILLINVKY